MKVNPESENKFRWPKLINNIETRKSLSLVDYYRRVMKELSNITFFPDQCVDKGYSIWADKEVSKYISRLKA